MFRNRPFFLAGAAILLVLLLMAVAVRLGRGSVVKSPEDADVTTGVAYLQQLEAQDPGSVETTLKDLYRQKLLAQRDERLQQLKDDPDSVWSMFDDYVILGDSRTCGFIFGRFLDESRILAGYGDTIWTIEDHIPEMKKINPSYIFLCYGLNDMVQYGWETPELYAASYREYLLNLQQEFPDAKIFVNSIFRCYEPAFSERWEKWRETAEYSAAIGEMAKSIGCYYIANENIDESYRKYWQEDGIHFISTFYPIWATNMIMEVYNSELGLELRDGQLELADDTAP